jgi:CHAD domain-containing protein
MRTRVGYVLAVSIYLERERKLEAPPNFSLAAGDIAAKPYTVAPATWRRLHTVYYDSRDLRLLRWDVSLRYRVGDGWTVKLPEPERGRSTFRTEHTFAGDGTHVPPAALDLVAAVLRGSQVEPIAELRTIRTQRTVSSDDGEVAEIVEDDVHVVRSHVTAMRFRQVEIELRSDTPERVLDELSRALFRAGAGSHPAPPKVTVAVGERPHDPEVTVPNVGRNARATDVVTAALAADVIRLVRLDAQLRVQPDPDGVHDARVSVRRLRSNLRTFRPLLHAAWSDNLRERLGWLSDALAEARDADVLFAGIEKRATTLPDANDRRHVDLILQPFKKQREAAYKNLSDALRSQKYLQLIDSVIGAARAPQFTPSAHRRARTLVDTVMQPVWRGLRKQVRLAGASPHDRDLHHIRIKAKYVRYAAEAMAPVVPRAQRLADRVEALQELLGDQHDAIVACGALREHRGETPESAFLAGEVAAGEQAEAERGRRRWRACWNSVRDKKLRFW